MARPLAVLVVAALVALAGCDDGDDGPMVLTDPGEAVTLEVGDEVVIDLESIAASTGFSWELREPFDPSVLELVDRSEIGSDDDLVGSPGRLQLTLRAVGAGETTVELWEIQPWLEEPEPNDEVVFRITVT